ncbi:hypothetical protein D7Y13_10255 [Corallococcus praedator]|uniref:Uncharacterized protein n=1 Tax=Corallococcus praedator TaxID=2316724 RepID=A0ABX9QLZ2_9BACT|nr:MULTISPECIES: hypothetical protein [Corallococcus]RKH18270.1 hypothetical protein D7X74_10165 [Corallococcus sp. CA047B]RKH32855.1 hypothetical protein D7X75_14270 [Corallococcus sp. CA031C]RKI11925.1 hypothetical protein D7Y13_10255 [Corallococcus praedator]
MKMKTYFRSHRALCLLLAGVLLSACEKDEPKPEPDPGSDVLRPGASGEGELTEQGQRVRYKLATQAGHFYRFGCEGDNLPRCEVRRLDPGTLEPLPPASDKVAAHASTTWRAAVDETAVVDVRSSVNTDVQVGRYAFDFSETDDTEGNTPEDAVSQPVPAEFTGRVNAPVPDDVDVFRFSIPQGHILSVLCIGTDGDAPDTEVVRADGTLLNRYTYLGPRDGESALSAENDLGEDLFLRVSFKAAQGRGQVEGYRCTVKDDGLDDHSDAPLAATVVAVPSTTAVVFWPTGDVDVLAVDLVEGHKYRLSTVSGGYPFYAGTTVMDAQGAVIAKDLVSNYNSGADFTAPGTGRYFLSLRRIFGPGVWKFIFPTAFTYSISEVAP